MNRHSEPARDANAGKPLGRRLLLLFSKILAGVESMPLIFVVVISAVVMMFDKQHAAHEVQLKRSGFETLATITAKRCAGKQWLWYQYVIDGRDYSGGCRHEQCENVSIGDIIHIYYEPEEPTNKICGSIVQKSE
jgi:hypothetical protein